MWDYVGEIIGTNQLVVNQPIGKKKHLSNW